MPKLFQPEQAQLSNGIPVILQHSDGPVAATYWWVRTGSADEAPKEAGFAHFLEHMLFKDAAAKETGKASNGKMARMIESLGGDINAYTSFDQTVYHVTCAAHQWERVIDVFGTIAKPQKFLKADFEREREVILEELRKNEDSPGRQLFQTLFSATFNKHPYGRPVIGFVKTLNAAKVGELEAFYQRNYVSSKMGLVLVGPLLDGRREKVLAYLEKHFGAKVLKKKPAVAHKRVVEPEIRKGPEFSTKTFDVKTPTLSVSFRVPDLLHPDIPALDLLSGVLGMGELSRLHRKLFYDAAIVTDVSGGLYVPSDPGMLYFQTELDSMEKIGPSAELLFKEIRRICEEGPTPEELARVLVNAESEKLYATQTADGLAGRVGFLRFVLGDLDFDQKYLEELRAVDAEKMKEVARKYLDHRRMAGVVMVPKTEGAFKASELADLAIRIFAPQTQVAPAKTAATTASPVQFFRLGSGMQVVYLHRPLSQVFSIHVAALGGLRLELTKPMDKPETDWGSSFMMSLAWNKGTTAHNAQAISALAEGNAASVEGFAGRNSIGLQMTGLARDWDKLSGLFAEVLLDPTFPQSEVDHARRIAEDSVRSIDDHTSQLCSKLFLESLFERHPYGKMTTGSLESLKAIHQDKLRAFHRAWIRPERLVVSVSGPVARPALDRWLADVEKRAQSVHKQTKPFELPAVVSSEPALKAPRWVEKALGREQTHILVGGLGTDIRSDDRHSIRLLQTLLGGQSGRLFIELREKKSLAYTVSPVSFEGIEKGYVGTYIACSPQKRDEAIKGIQGVLTKFASQGSNKAEMNRAKEYFLGRRAMDLQSDSSLAAHYGLETLYGVPYLTDQELMEKIRGVSSEDLQRVCTKYWVEPYMVTSVVG